MPGEEPARIDTTSRSSGPVSPGWPSTIRPARSRAVPDGRSSLARRCHSTRYGSNASSRPKSATAESTSRPKSATPRLKFDAATAARRGPGSRPSTRSRSAVQPVVAMTNRSTPASSALARFVATASRSGGLDDDVGAGEGRGIVPPVGRPAEDPDVIAAPAGDIGHGRPEAAVAEDEDGLHVRDPSLRSVRGRRVRRVPDNEKPRSPSWCRGPWSLRSLEAPVRRRRAVRAPGPVPPGRAARASSSTPRRRFGGSYAEPYA